MNRLKIAYSFEKKFALLFDFEINLTIGREIALFLKKENPCNARSPQGIYILEK
jgi:hypothetical protein